ncbi:hypothetical protein KDJ56_11065 [Brevibacillus composti]|uniref:Uncharacterized protein n=1 Tax=Brevibacillus composti TaxID=2796470 RepID=A0ABX7ZAV6_9BACL|nr:hypothetical protein [Brevibacillus composti]QUO43440.1 hypothetical protein KDJ56_11065 [Brevibacillus composti]
MSRRSVSRFWTAAYLICPVCRYISVIQRRKCKLKKSGHIKTMWCPVCQEVRQHIEAKEWEIAERYAGNDR